MASTVSPRVPAHRHGITPGWLTRALRSTGVIAQATRGIACVQHPVAAVTVSGEAREDGGGISGPQILRLALTYDGGPGPAQILAQCGNWQDTHQMPAWPLKSRLIHVLGHRRLEEHLRSDVTFFQPIRPHLRGLLLPQISSVAMAEARSVSAWSYVVFDRRTPLRFCVLMDDLTVAHFAAGKPGERRSSTRMAQALLTMAPLHAFGWKQPHLWAHLRLRPTPFLPFLRADEGLLRQHRDRWVQTHVIPTLLTRWAPHRGQDAPAHGLALLQQPEMVAMRTACNASCSTWAPEATHTARRAPHTIVHGDCHGWNHLFNPHDACRLIDCQCLGTGRVTDAVASCFTRSFDPDPEAEETLLRLSHHALVAAGVHASPYEHLVHEYRVSVLTLLLDTLVRAVTFLTPSAYARLARNPKWADLLLLGDMVRERLMTRALHWYHTPHLRNAFFSVEVYTRRRSP